MKARDTTLGEEPKTMARYTVWKTGSRPMRHVAVKFKEGWVKGVATTWIDAMADVDRQRKAGKP